MNVYYVFDYGRSELGWNVAGFFAEELSCNRVESLEDGWKRREESKGVRMILASE